MQPDLDPDLIEAALSLGCDPSEIVLMLRTCNERLQGYGGFQWPASGLVAAPDWSAEPECGAGLHGFLYGVGDGGLANWSENAHWLVVAVQASEIVSLWRGEKYKFPRAFVLHASQDRHAATQYLYARLPPGTFPVMGISLAGGHCSTLTGGRGSTLTGGEGSALTFRWRNNRARWVTAYVGEGGIASQVAYRCSDSGVIERA